MGCADSRVPPNLVVGLEPGEIFVHRNVANVVSPSDGNVMAVLQFAVDVLKVAHIIVCGHYGCGGVRASLEPQQAGPLGIWIDQIAAIGRRHVAELKQLDSEQRLRRPCELNAPRRSISWRRRRSSTVPGTGNNPCISTVGSTICIQDC